MPFLLPQIDATIPDGLTDLEAFRSWAKSDEYPDRGRFAFLNGNVWMDLSMEAGNSHNRVKTAFAITLGSLVEDLDLGQYFGDGMLVSHTAAGLSTIPDGVFVSHESVESGAVARVGGAANDFVELLGTPDVVLEVVSESSVEKDTELLPELYWQAGIPEFWLVDARKELTFDIFRHGPKGYAAARKQAGGWVKSAVFGRSFRLTSGTNRAGDRTFKLDVK